MSDVQAEPPKCPRCRSIHLSAGTKGFGVGKAVAGGLVAGPIGLAAGALGSGGVRLVCLSCGHRWDPKNLGVLDSMMVSIELAALPEDHPRRVQAAAEAKLNFWIMLILSVVALFCFKMCL